MDYPPVFDQARGKDGEHETTFKHVQCDRCRYLVREGEYEGCSREGYAIPFEGSVMKKCPDHEEA